MYALKENVDSEQPQKNLFRSYSKLVRPTVVMMGLTNGMVGVIYAGITLDNLLYVIIALLSIAAIAAFSYGYNQLTDLDEDRINAPHRPLVTGELSVNECKAFLVALLVISFAPLLFLGRFIAFFLMLAGPVFSGVVYSKFRIKSFIIKPFFVAYGWSFVPIIAYSAVTNSMSPLFFIFVPFFLLLMFLTTTMGDLRDIEGDKENGVKTLPVIFGIKAVITNLQIYTVLNYSLLVAGIILNILPADATLGVIGGYLLIRYLRTSDVLSRQKGMKKSLARFSWITSIGLVAGRIIGITVGIIL
ncbi:MAG: UbiA prenyltransferase family protein [Candidatus Hodarchaeales archaeon]|jgi:4-hydroxybenzoate polyprenyltransferase